MFLAIRDHIVNVDHIIAIMKDGFVLERFTVVLSGKAESIPLSLKDRDELIWNLSINHLTLLHKIDREKEDAECTQLQQEPLNYDTSPATATESRP